MSGICGIGLREQADRIQSVHLSPMVEALAMSEDSQAYLTSLGRIGMGAQGFPGRLAGVAEMTVHGSALALAFHGSLYNLRELFATRQQIANPVMGLLHLYLQERTAFLTRLRGEFALALWDGLEETLYLATDRFRVHPILYYHDQDKLVFSSRMIGLLACPLPIKRTISPEAIVDVAAGSIIPTPRTIFQEVKKLPPGHMLTYRRGEVKLAPYWDISFLQADGATAGELSQKLRVGFREALAVRLAGDGLVDRIGTFLSGGVDSSTITGMLIQLAQHPIKSFSIGFHEQHFNEMNYARISARAFGAEHYEYFVTPQDAYGALPRLLEAFDEPFANASAIPTYFCAQMARAHGVDVLYAGDGGDELFAGNARYATQRLFEYYHRIPGSLREHVVRPLVFALADRLNWPPAIKGKKYIQRAILPYPERLSSYGLFTVVPMTELFEDGLLEAIGREYNPDALVHFYYHQASTRSELDRQLYIDLKLIISDNDLFKVTRMTEAAGITVRFPFLDHRLVDFATTIPAHVKMPGRKLRAFFKRAYADVLPHETITKEKHGFGLPIPVWLRTDKRFNELMHELVLSAISVQRGYFRKKTLEALIDHHKADKTSFYGTILWNLMVLELWCRRHDDRRSLHHPLVHC